MAATENEHTTSSRVMTATEDEHPTPNGGKTERKLQIVEFDPIATQGERPATNVDMSFIQIEDLTKGGTTELPRPDATTGAPNSRTTEILSALEHYFCDDNLRGDAHLLALFREGNGSVDLSDVCSFRRVRKFKPVELVREALQHSSLLQLSTDGTRLRRRFPLGKPMTVQPKINAERKRTVVPQDKPWLTKAMMKPTGFEENATDGPIRPAEYEEDRKDYDPEIVFTSRIETAITRFCSRRKMHQETRRIFDMFMLFGGMAGGQRQFTGGTDKADLEDLTKKEIAELTSYFGVSERVVDGLYAGEDGTPATWYVDFEKIAKAFLSSHFVTNCNWYDEEQVATTANILRNFYNYFLLHDVCSEYRDNILAARKVCDLAEQELPVLKNLDMGLPGGFNVACSTLFQGEFAGVYASGADWTRTGDNIGWSEKDAQLVFTAAIFAHGSEEQIRQHEEVVENGTQHQMVSLEEVGLEITATEPPNEAAKSIYSSSSFKDTLIRPMGKLKCKSWTMPHAAPPDVPKSVKAARKKGREYTFLIDEETLQYCVPGMKIDCVVKSLDLGIQWIDHVEAVYATFFTWVENERIRDWTEPGPPKDE